MKTTIKDGQRTCSKCRNAFPATPEFFYRNSKGALGLHWRCKSCQKIAVLQCQSADRVTDNANRKRYRVKLKAAAIRAYGGDPPTCACCGEHREEFLSIDHINGGGNKHRKETGNNPVRMYVWLKRNNYPKGFRILCYNCNLSRGFHGYCPHDREKENGKVSEHQLTSVA